MCGICGWLNWEGLADPVTVRPMVRALAHRGPDGEGIWREPRGRVVLGHRRLAVLDLSHDAAQPMIADNGTAVVYNGEIYDFRTLRTDLEGEGIHVRSTGDTEVVLAALNRWGRGALDRMNGQFALAFWDPEAGRLLLARDRLGIKPLFWAETDGGVAFASEIPALLRHPGVRRDLDRAAVGSWLQLGYGAGEQTLVRGVRRIPPGHLLWIERDGFRLERWYDPLEACRNRNGHADVPREELVDRLEAGLRTAVGDRLISDVPIGCFLSGGVDSGAVVGAAVARGSRPETLTIRFLGGADESGAAAAAARALDLNHAIADCGPDDLLSALEGWGGATGDPLADPSFAPTSVVSAEARRRWTVVLSGDGGDELLSGYPRLRAMPRIEKLLRVPAAFRSIPGWMLPARRWASKLPFALRSEDRWEAYQALQGVWPRRQAGLLLSESELPCPWGRELTARVEDLDPWTRWRALDLLTSLPERMLAKVDRAGMRHGLEVRVPLLDHRIVELLLAADSRWTRGKEVLRDVAGRFGVPPRPKRKTGFEIPLAVWLRGPLKEPVSNSLFGTTADEIGLHRRVLENTWNAHQSGSMDVGERLLAVAVLTTWVEDVLG